MEKDVLAAADQVEARVLDPRRERGTSAASAPGGSISPTLTRCPLLAPATGCGHPEVHVVDHLAVDHAHPGGAAPPRSPAGRARPPRRDGREHLVRRARPGRGGCRSCRRSRGRGRAAASARKSARRRARATTAWSSAADPAEPRRRAAPRCARTAPRPPRPCAARRPRRRSPRRRSTRRSRSAVEQRPRARATPRAVSSPPITSGGRAPRRAGCAAGAGSSYLGSTTPSARDAGDGGDVVVVPGRARGVDRGRETRAPTHRPVAGGPRAPWRARRPSSAGGDGVLEVDRDRVGAPSAATFANSRRGRRGRTAGCAATLDGVSGPPVHQAGAPDGADQSRRAG